MTSEAQRPYAGKLICRSAIQNFLLFSQAKQDRVMFLQSSLARLFFERSKDTEVVLTDNMKTGLVPGKVSK